MESRPPSDVKEQVQRHFGAVAGRYAVSAVHQEGPDLRALVAAAAPLAGRRVLDLGCGAGHTGLALARAGAHEEPQDLTPEMLEQVERAARAEGLERVRTRLGDAEALPYPDARFDRVACRLCAHHFGDARRALVEAIRVLRPGGRLLWIDSVTPEAAAEDTFLNAIELLRDPSHVRNHRASEWLSWMADCGLVAHHAGDHPMELDFASWFERMRTPDWARQAIRALFDAAPETVARRFGHRPGAAAWTIPIALLVGDKPGG